MTDEPKLPEYRWGEAPANLRTKKQLAEQGQRPGSAQVAWLVWGRRNDPNKAALFNADEAVAKRQASPAQLEALAHAREAKWQSVCPECGQRTYCNPDSGMCFACEEKLQKQQDDDVRRKAAKWAFNVMARRTLILDTETTDLDGFIVQLAVIDIEGNVLFNTLINPGVPIPKEATAIHGITDEMVADAPTFASIEPALQATLTGRRVSGYNVGFDHGRLHAELRRAHDLAYNDYGWLTDVMWRDVMVPYSNWVGDWSEYHGEYRLQPLNGGHTALGDCQETLRLLKLLAADYMLNLAEQPTEQES
ncbi:MAG: 3'-5' exonuclease [Caldilineaceae bacterium]